MLDTPESAARSLYDVLHRCDALARKARSLWCCPAATKPEWRAVRDRADASDLDRLPSEVGRLDPLAGLSAWATRRHQSNSRRWESKIGRSSGSGGGTGRFKWGRPPP